MATSAKTGTRTGSGEWGPTRFLREAIDELRKVVWPTGAELYRYTIVVVATVIVIATFIGAVDYGVGELVKRFVYNAVTSGAVK